MYITFLKCTSGNLLVLTHGNIFCVGNLQCSIDFGWRFPKLYWLTVYRSVCKTGPQPVLQLLYHGNWYWQHSAIFMVTLMRVILGVERNLPWWCRIYVTCPKCEVTVTKHCSECLACESRRNPNSSSRASLISIVLTNPFQIVLPMALLFTRRQRETGTLNSGYWWTILLNFRGVYTGTRCALKLMASCRLRETVC